MNSSIAIVGMACVYPDARTPGELWENVLAQRRAFRRLPAERLRLEDYFSTDAGAADATYATQAAVIEGYEFDRVAFRVAGSTFRAADLAHWLALDVAARALADAGFAEGNGLPREGTGVLIGNTLTGEFSRANGLRLRWPYVRRVVAHALAGENWPAEQREKFLAGLEEQYKAPFPPVGEETLAGGLSNTIAGRICNQFDLKGGGYTVDGACASSLLAAANACSALTARDLDVAIAGGVDLSLDPFEIVGFAKTGALAPEEMRVFDKHSAGFWPGEGCGMVVLMRHEDALAQGRRVYAVIRGWGISSDGSGGITRPEADGQLEALRRAYRRAGFGIETVAYCEGHGTGTAVGDATELEVLSRARRERKTAAPAAAIGSIKANIGHTKAAAGVAGLIKATMAVHTQVLPPTTGCEQPHAQFGGAWPALRVLREAEAWPADRPLRASVSAMGFGGINAHLVIESVVAERRAALSARERSLERSRQDAELFLLAADAPENLMAQIGKVRAVAGGISRAELADLAAELQRTLRPGKVRAGVVARTPAELAECLEQLGHAVMGGAGAGLAYTENIFIGSSTGAPRIAFLFPGQGSPTHLDGGLWRRRFEGVRELYERAELPADGDAVSTRVMQPAVVTASLAALKVLGDLGITAGAAVGHSLGEITALHWAGAFDEETLRRLARVRGAAMADLGSPTGVMLAIAATWHEVLPLLNGEPLAIVGYNSPRQTVVAGEAEAGKKLARRAAGRGWPVSPLPVSHAFHTQLVAAAVPVLAGQLAREKISGPQRAVFSTVTAARLAEGEDVRELLCRQVTSPVRFEKALAALLGEGEGDIDLLIEAGPGSVLSGLAGECGKTPVIALDAGGNSLTGLLRAAGAAFALGAPVQTAALFADRFVRPFALEGKAKFFANPCELAPVAEAAERRASRPIAADMVAEPAGAGRRPGTETDAPIELVRRLVAERAELPIGAVRDESRMLSDLHLNSITVGQLVSLAAKQLGLPRVAGLTEFANATVAEMGQALAELRRTGGAARASGGRELPAGVEPWVRAFVVDWVEVKRANISKGAAASGMALSRKKNQRAGAEPRLGKETGARAWRIFALKKDTLAGALGVALERTGVGGVAVFLPPNPGVEMIPLLLEAGRAAMAMTDAPRFLVVQHGWGGGGFARTLHLENPHIATRVVNVEAVSAADAWKKAVKWIADEAGAMKGFVEVQFLKNGRRFESRLALAGGDSRMRMNVGAEDVLLVTGGGKGIAAECALAFARETGVKLALIGRSDPKTDPELANNFARFAAAGVRSGYARADVTDAAAVRAAVAEIERQLGPVTGILHGAGVNTPQLIGALDEAAFRRTVAPKVLGLKNVLAAVNEKKLKLLVAFGSIIARAGLPGEADYATANEWLAAGVDEFQTRHPRCRCLTLEWSVWSGAGMGERLASVETLAQQGITAISVDDGVRTFCELLRPPAKNTSPGRGSLVVSGRFGELPTLKMSRPELPLRRFLERPRVFYPGVELIVDVKLSLSTDPYLADHVMQKQPLLPAVVGLEALAQAAMALTGSTQPPHFENVEFPRPVGVPGQGSVTVRLAALARENGDVEVCLRSEETDFQVDHFRAVCRFETGAAEDGGWRMEDGRARRAEIPSSILHSPSSSVNLDPKTDLYGRLLFHGGRFQRLRGYQRLRAKECAAEIEADGDAPWFAPYWPAEFVLGNPAGRDAALHAIQACIPHRRILPTGMGRAVIFRSDPGAHIVRAKERSRDGNDFVYDVEIADARGELIERWEGLRLRAVEVLPAREAWPEALLGPYLERRLEELAAIPSSAPVKIALEYALPGERPATTDAALQQALGRTARIWRRPDGKPLAGGEENISAAHAGRYTLAVAAASGVACDLAEVSPRTETAWRDLLGREKFQLAERLAREPGESADAAATRVWAALECLKKIGQPANAPLLLESTTDDGWTLLRAGAIILATCVVGARESQWPLVAAVALKPRGEPQAARAQAAVRARPRL